MPYGFGRQLPIIPPSLINLNLPPNPFNILATMAEINPTEVGHDENYSPSHQSHQNHRQSHHHPWTWLHLTVGKLRMPPWTTTLSSRRTSQDECTGHLHWMKLSIRTGKHKRVYLLSSPSPPSLPMKRKLEMGMFFRKRRGPSQHVCVACGENIPPMKDTPGPSTKDQKR